MIQLFQKIRRSPAPVSEPSWEVEYLVQKFLQRYQAYSEQQVREAAQAVFRYITVPVTGEVMMREVRERLEGV